MKKDNLTKYHSSSGLATKAWGPSGWYFLFSCIMGAYPVKIEKNNKEHRKIRKHFKDMFASLEYTMPCVFCRRSYKSFCRELPINQFLNGRISLMKWLYLIRDKVNNKLIKQERKCYKDEKKRLKTEYRKGHINKYEYYVLLDKFKSVTLITFPSPPFEEVLQKYESIRAVCSDKAKTCSLPKK